MPSFDVVSEIDWQEVDNAKSQALKETQQRFDFKKVTCEVEVNPKDKLITLNTSGEEKMEAFTEVFRAKLAKRGLSLLSFDFQAAEVAGNGGSRRQIKVQAGIDKDKAKTIVKTIKEQKFKAQAQIQDEQVRVSAKKRDDLQEIITFLKDKQQDFKLPLQFENFRD